MIGFRSRSSKLLFPLPFFTRQLWYDFGAALGQFFISLSNLYNVFRGRNSKGIEEKSCKEIIRAPIPMRNRILGFRLNVSKE